MSWPAKLAVCGAAALVSTALVSVVLPDGWSRGPFGVLFGLGAVKLALAWDELDERRRD